MKALVLSGGSGTRLCPITHTCATQLVPAANKPVLFYGPEAIADAGITEVGIVVGDTAAEIREAVGDGSRFGLDVTYLPQDRPADLAHAVLIAREFLGADDFVMYLGDNFEVGGITPLVESFRHGLSYTTVSYGPPVLSRAPVPAGAPALTCTVTVTDTGRRPVCETAQSYVRRLSGSSSWPRVRELRGFARVRLGPGESARAVFDIDADTLASVTRDLALAVEPGGLLLETGPSSDRTRAARLRVGSWD
jgi:hypothetical protein